MTAKKIKHSGDLAFEPNVCKHVSYLFNSIKANVFTYLGKLFWFQGSIFQC